MGYQKKESSTECFKSVVMVKNGLNELGCDVMYDIE